MYTIALPADAPDVPVLRFAGNDVTVMRNDQGASQLDVGCLALKIDLSAGDATSVLVSANQIAGDSLGQLADIYVSAGLAAITGNAIYNPRVIVPPPPLSVVLYCGASSTMSLSGNACRGPFAVAPTDPNALGCTSTAWNLLNSQKA